DDVDLHIDPHARPQRAERRHLEGVRNQTDAEARTVDIVDRETDAVDGDGALARDVAGELSRHFERDSMGPTVVLHAHHLGDAVDMARDVMPPERLPRTERLLEIYSRSFAELTERRDAQCLPRDIRREARAFDARRREAASVHADAAADCNRIESERARLDRQFHIAALRRDGAN